MVLIWLGEEEEGVAAQSPGRTDRWLKRDTEVSSSQLKSLIERLSKAQVLRDELGDTRNKHQLQWVGLKKYDLPEMNDPGYEAFLQLLTRQYFSRGWILQEIALARDLYVRFGPASVKYIELHNALVACNSFGFTDGARLEDLYCFMGVARMRKAIDDGITMDLLTLLLKTRLTETTDARDKIYCLLGLATDRELLDITPDYATSVEDVYRDFTVRHIQSHGHLDVLGVPRGGEQATLPTWVADWRLKNARFISPLDGRDRDEKCSYCATKSSHASITLNSDPRLLGLSGISLDKVEKCGVRKKDAANTGTGAREIIRQAIRIGLDIQLEYLDWKYVALLHTRKAYVAGGSREDAFWRSLAAGNLFDPNTNFDVVRNNYKAWSQYQFLYVTLRWLLPDFILIPLLWFKMFLRICRTSFALCCWVPAYGRNLRQEAFFNLTLSTNGRVIIRTRDGYIGLAPEATMEGDTIALFEGGKLPFVIRQRRENWMIIGPCYIHGMMDGEAFTEEKCSTMWIE
jgi:hypothetical protein